MKSQARQTLAENINRMIDHHSRGQRRSVRAWALAHQLEQRVAARALGETGATVDTLQRIEDAVDVEPWQLLYPGLRPGAAPAPPTLSVEALDVARAQDQISDSGRRAEACLLIQQFLAFEMRGIQR